MAFGTKRLVFIITGTDQLTPVLKKISGEAVSTADKMNAAGKLMTKAITLPVLAGAAASVKMATDFNASMKRIQTQTAGSAKDVAELSKQVLNLGLYAEQSPKELADALYHLKSVGMDNVSAMKALKSASDLAAVGQSNLEDTATAVAGAWRAGVKGAKNFSQSAATLNAIVGAGNMKMQDLVNAMGTGFLSTARTFGVSLKSVGSALALLTDEGIPAKVAATRLRMAMALLGAPTAKAAKELAGIGLSSTALAYAMRHGGISEAIGLLITKMKAAGLNAVQSAQLITASFGGGRSASAIMALVNNYGVLQKKQEQINKSMSKFGPSVAAQRKTAAAQFALLKSSVDVLAVRIGNVLLPMVLTLTRGFAGLFTVFAKLPKPAMETVLALLGIAAVAGPILILTANMIKAVEVVKEWSVVQALLDAELMGTGIPEIVASIALLIAAVLLVIKYHKQLWKVAQDVWNWLRAHQWVLLFTGVIGILAEIGMHWRGIETIAVNVWHAIYNASQILWKGIQIGASATLSFLQPLFKVIEVAGKIAFLTIQLSAKIAWDLVSGLALLAWAVIKPILNALAATGKWVFRTILAPAAKFAWLAMTTEARAMWAVLNPIFHLIASVAKWLFNNVIAPEAKQTWNGIKSAVRVMGDVVSTVFHAMASVARTVWNTIYNVIKTLINLVLKVIRGFLNTVLSVFGSIVHGAAKAFGWLPGLGGKLKTAASQFDQFKKNVNNALSSLKDKKVAITFGLNLPKGVSYPSRPIKGHATGGRVFGPGTGTSDSIPSMLSNGEYVVKASSTSKYGYAAMNAVNQGNAVIGYAEGGAVGVVPSVRVPTKSYTDKAIENAYKVGLQAVVAYGRKIVNQALDGNGSAMVAFAEQFVGRVPYVWGGTTTSGWDCSGFTSYVYKHFGINNIPRVSQDQQRWAQRSGNVPGALVFFGRPAYHVGIATGGSNYVGADSPAIGTAIRSAAGNSGFGVPPGGLGGALTGGGARGGAVALGREMAARYGWIGYQWTDLYNLWQKESGWNPNARNPSSGAAGIPQDISGNFHGGAAGQIAWGLNYILHRYGSPARAWAHEMADNWYRHGGLVTQSFDTGRGVLRPGYTLAYNGTGRNEHLSTDNAGGNVVVNIYPQAVLGTKREVARYVAEALQEHKNKGGRLPS